MKLYFIQLTHKFQELYFHRTNDDKHSQRKSLSKVIVSPMFSGCASLPQWNLWVFILHHCRVLAHRDLSLRVLSLTLYSLYLTIKTLRQVLWSDWLGMYVFTAVQKVKKDSANTFTAVSIVQWSQIPFEHCPGWTIKPLKDFEVSLLAFCMGISKTATSCHQPTSLNKTVCLWEEMDIHAFLNPAWRSDSY